MSAAKADASSSSAQNDKNKDTTAAGDVFDAAIARFDQLVSKANALIRKVPDAAPPAAGAETTTDTNPRPQKRSKYDANPEYPYGSFPSTDDDYLNFYLPPLKRGYKSQEIPVPLQRSAKQEEAIKTIEPQMPVFTAEMRPTVRAFLEYIQRDMVRTLNAKSTSFGNNDSFCAMYRQLKVYSTKLGFGDCFPLGKEHLTKTQANTTNEGRCGHKECAYVAYTAPPSVEWRACDWQVSSQIYDWVMSHSAWTSEYYPHLVIGLHPKTNMDHGLECNNIALGHAGDYFDSLVRNCMIHCKWYNALSNTGKIKHEPSYKDACDLNEELAEIEEYENGHDDEHDDDGDGSCECGHCMDGDAGPDDDDEGDEDYDRDDEDADDTVKTWKGKGKVKKLKAETARDAARLKTWRRLEAMESNDRDDDVVTDMKKTQKTSKSSSSSSSSSKTAASKKKPRVSRRERLGL